MSLEGALFGHEYLKEKVGIVNWVTRYFIYRELNSLNGDRDSDNDSDQDREVVEMTDIDSEGDSDSDRDRNTKIL